MIDLRFSESELEAVRDHAVEFIREQTSAAGTESAILGLSGGIDSTLTAHLTVEALGAENVHGLVMPGAVSSEEHMSDAELVAETLEIPFDVVEINPVVESFLDAFPEAGADREPVGNLRARTRAVLSYLMANHENSMVIGTGNRTEALVGYFTKYGDGAVDCHPIGTLYKAQVRQLARHVGVPEAFVEKTPTAELWAGQTDEGELGMDYDTLDAILALSVDGPLSPAATARELPEVEMATVERVHAMVSDSAHKRAVPPSPDPLF